MILLDYDLKPVLIFSHVYDFLKMLWIVLLASKLTEIYKNSLQEEKYLINISIENMAKEIKIGYYFLFLALILHFSKTIVTAKNY